MIESPKYCARCGHELEDRVPPLDHRPRRMCPACGFVHYAQPKVAAGSIPEKDGKIALVQRGIGPRKGYWSFPCGFMEIDEDVASAAKRETEEETGLRVELTGHLGTYSYAESPHGGSIVIVAYASRVVGGELRAPDDVGDARWTRPGEIPWDDLAFQSSHEALRDWLRKNGRGQD